MAGWALWLGFAVTLGMAEILTLTAAPGILGVAAAFTAVVAMLGLPVPLQLVVFAGCSIAGIVLLRPAVQRQQTHRFGVDALIRVHAQVVQEVTATAGRVRLGGEEWTARAFDETLTLPPGSVVDVMQINGNTALVYPREAPWRSKCVPNGTSAPRSWARKASGRRRS